MNRWLILFCAFLLFVSACKDDASRIDELAAKCKTGDKEACKKLTDIAKNNDDFNTRKAAVEKLTDQSALTDIARNSLYSQNRLAAVEKLTDQKVLASIAMNDKEWSVQMAAVEKLTDQKLLADIAKNDKDGSVGMTAVEKLTDQSVLAKLALEVSSFNNRAFTKLKDQASLTKATVDDKDWRVRLIFKFIAAFDPVPAEHRERLMNEVFPAIQFLSYPAVVSEVGDIVSIRTEWISTSRYYIGIGASGGQMKGEIFTCSIKVQKLTEPLSHKWSTSYPETVAIFGPTASLGFHDARVNPGDLLNKPFDKLTDQSVLAEIFKNSGAFGVRRAILEKLTDQKMIEDFARNEKDSYVRKAAVEKLTDQALLADIARNDKEWIVRRAAVEKLTDENTLADIAKNDENEYVRSTAERSLEVLREK